MVIFIRNSFNYVLFSGYSLFLGIIEYTIILYYYYYIPITNQSLFSVVPVYYAIVVQVCGEYVNI